MGRERKYRESFQSGIGELWVVVTKESKGRAHSATVEASVEEEDGSTLAHFTGVGCANHARDWALGYVAGMDRAMVADGVA